MNINNDHRSEIPENSDDSNSICSFTHSSCDSMSEASYELTPWHGKLSMSWESIGPDAMSSSLFLAPQTTGAQKYHLDQGRASVQPFKEF